MATQNAVFEPQTIARKRSWTKVVLLILLLAVLAAAGTALYLHFQDRVSSDDAEVDGHITAVAPKISGNVTEVLVLDNQPVKVGQVLVRIDPRDYQVRLDQERAALAEAESRLRAARAGVPLSSETVEAGTSVSSAEVTGAQAELERARAAAEQASGPDLAYQESNVASKEASNERAQADLARMRPLVQKAEISQQQFDSFVAAAKVADSELKGAREELASARQEVNMRKAAADAAQSRLEQARSHLQGSVANRRQTTIRTADAGTAGAAVEAARAHVAAAELQLSYTTLTAPIAGVVTRKSVEVGQIVQPGQALMTIIPLEDTWVSANFKETQLANVRPGQRAEIKVDMYDKTISGHVDSIAGATGSRLSLLPPENATGNFVKVVQRIPVKILVDRKPGEDLVLRPGMNVDVTIFTR